MYWWVKVIRELFNDGFCALINCQNYIFSQTKNVVFEKSTVKMWHTLAGAKAAKGWENAIELFVDSFCAENDDVMIYF